MTKKIDLREYIKNYRYTHPEFVDFDKGSISASILQQKSEYSDIIEACTTDVYPQLLELGNEKTFIWDHTYWMLYRRFLLGIFRFHPKTSKIDDLSDFITSFISLFLSLRFTNLPAYSYYFASRYYRTNELICHFRMYSDKEEEKKFEDIYGLGYFGQLNEFAQAFVYFHELRHYAYKINNDFFLYESELNKLPKDHPNNYDHIWDTYHYFAENNDKIFEEVCCDIFSIVEFVHNLTQKKVNMVKNIYLQHSAVRSDTLFKCRVFLPKWSKY
jgi:hypothetical protein